MQRRQCPSDRWAFLRPPFFFSGQGCRLGFWEPTEERFKYLSSLDPDRPFESTWSKESRSIQSLFRPICVQIWVIQCDQIYLFDRVWRENGYGSFVSIGMLIARVASRLDVCPRVCHAAYEDWLRCWRGGPRGLTFENFIFTPVFQIFFQIGHPLFLFYSWFSKIFSNASKIQFLSKFIKIKIKIISNYFSY